MTASTQHRGRGAHVVWNDGHEDRIYVSGDSRMSPDDVRSGIITKVAAQPDGFTIELRMAVHEAQSRAAMAGGQPKKYLQDTISWLNGVDEYWPEAENLGERLSPERRSSLELDGFIVVVVVGMVHS